jgi:hypothetical protein
MMEQPMHKKTDEKRSRMFSSFWKAALAGAGLFIASGYALAQTVPQNMRQPMPSDVAAMHAHMMGHELQLLVQGGDRSHADSIGCLTTWLVPPHSFSVTHRPVRGGRQYRVQLSEILLHDALGPDAEDRDEQGFLRSRHGREPEVADGRNRSRLPAWMRAANSALGEACRRCRRVTAIKNCLILSVAERQRDDRKGKIR